MPTTDHRADPGAPASRAPRMDHRMPWVMMIGCCLALPLAVIFGGAGLAGRGGASPWLIGVGVVLAIALVVVRRRAEGSSRAADEPLDRAS